jgi:hypothetical protein
MRSTDTARNLSLQTPSSIIDRLDALTAWAAKQTDISPTGHAQRAQVHRAALQLGLQLLEVRAANDGVLGVGREGESTALSTEGLGEACCQAV